MRFTVKRTTSPAKRGFLLSLLLLGVLGHAPMATAQSPGTFTPTGDMTTRRYLHTATLLNDGRVLIAGGVIIESSGGPPPGVFKTQSSAEIYDPRTGTFTPAGNMTTPRHEHTATLLPDGRVLIVGGGIVSGGDLAALALASAEIFDPGTRMFSPTGDMATARVGPTATLLNNGKVLIAGGFQRVNQACCALASTELYDPSTGSFTPSGDMTSWWPGPVTLLADGRVLINYTDIYDPATGVFSPTGIMVLGKAEGPTATLLLNDKVLFAGGEMGDGEGGATAAELYDARAGNFSATASMTVDREQHTATFLPDGTVLVAGGHNVALLAASAEIYDPVKGTFNATGSMPTPRELHTATLLVDGRVLIAGGDDERYWAPDTILSSALLYTPAVLVPAPALFSVSGDGTGQGAILHANTPRVASSTDPAIPGEYLEIYLTGLADGSVIPPQVSIGGRLAEVVYFCKSGGASVNQVNVRVPSGVAPGPAVPVRLTYIGRPSNEVTIGVQ